MKKILVLVMLVGTMVCEGQILGPIISGGGGNIIATNIPTFGQNLINDGAGHSYWGAASVNSTNAQVAQYGIYTGNVTNTTLTNGISGPLSGPFNGFGNGQRLTNLNGVLNLTNAPWNVDNTGVTDVSSSLQAAIDYITYSNSPLKEIYAPPGIYLYSNLAIRANSGTLSSTKPSTRKFVMCGDSQGMTHFWNKNQTNGAGLYFISTFSSGNILNGFELKHISFDGPGVTSQGSNPLSSRTTITTNYSTVGFMIYSTNDTGIAIAANLNINDCAFNGFKSGIEVSNTITSDFSDNYFEYNWKHCIHEYQSDSANIVHNIMGGNGETLPASTTNAQKAAIYVEKGLHTKIDNNEIGGWVNGIWTSQNGTKRMTGNNFELITGYAIIIEDLTASEIGINSYNYNVPTGAALLLFTNGGGLYSTVSGVLPTYQNNPYTFSIADGGGVTGYFPPTWLAGDSRSAARTNNTIYNAATKKTITSINPAMEDVWYGPQTYLGTNQVTEEVVSGGITLGGVRNTTWPAGGSAYYGPNFTNLTLWDTGPGVVIGTNVDGAYMKWKDGALTLVGGNGVSSGTNLWLYSSLVVTNPMGAGGDNVVIGSNGTVTATQTITAKNLVGNGAGVTNLYGTNVLGRSYHVTNVTANVSVPDASKQYQDIVLTTGTNVAGFANLVTGIKAAFSVCYSNSTGGTIVITNAPTSFPIGGVTTNQVNLLAGKQCYWSFDIIPGVRTNYCNAQ